MPVLWASSQIGCQALEVDFSTPMRFAILPSQSTPSFMALAQPPNMISLPLWRFEESLKINYRLKKLVLCCRRQKPPYWVILCGGNKDIISIIMLKDQANNKKCLFVQNAFNQA